MTWPFIGKVGDLATARADIAGIRLATAFLTGILGLTAAVLLCAAGLVALSQSIGFPLAALVVAMLLCGLAMGVTLVGRRLVSRKRERAAVAMQTVRAELAVATSLTRTAGPLLPIATFLAVFFLARRQ